MEKNGKFFITTLVAGLVALSAVLVIPTQLANALIGTNQIADNAITSPKIRDGEVKTPDLATAAVTKEKLNPNAVKLVVIERQSEGSSVPSGATVSENVPCHSDEFVTGGGFSGSGLSVDRSRLAGNNGWVVTAFNSPSNPETESIFAYVECAHLELGP